MNTESISLIREELALAGYSHEDEQRLKKLEARRIRSDTQLPEVEFLFRLQNRPCFARGELVGLSGKAKSGKTFVCSILMALCFRNEVLSVERIDAKPLHVLWYDTEQSEESTQDILRHRIMPMTGIQTADGNVFEEYLHVFNVRGEAWADRLPMLETAVRYYRPDLVVLDGIRDLVADINDGVVAQDVVERLMHLASECHCCMVCVLHQNKSYEDRNLRGWIGTELKNKAFEVYECAKSSERIFTWSQTDTRKYDIPEGISFSVDEQGIPYRCTERQLIEAQFKAQRKMADKLEKKGRSNKPYNDLNPRYAHKEGRRHVFNVKQLFSDIMPSGQIYKEDDLKTEIYAKTYAVKDKIHDEILRKAVSEKVILQSYDSFGHRIYVLPVPASQEPELPL
jgi:hypothetical protein